MSASLVKMYSQQQNGSWGNAENIQTLTAKFQIPPGYIQVMAVLQGFDFFFPSEDKHLNRGMIMLQDPNCTSANEYEATVEVTCDVMLRDEGGKSRFTASVIIGLIATYPGDLEGTV